MQEIVTCPECRRRLQVPPEVMGQRVQCPSCKVTFLADHGPPPSPIGMAAPAPADAVTAEPPPFEADFDESAPSSTGASQRRRGRKLPVPQQPKSSRKILIIGAAIACVVGGFVCITSMNSGPRWDGVKKNAAFKDAEPIAMAPLLPGPKLTDVEQKRAAWALLDRLGNAVKQKQGTRAIASCFDGARTVDELIALELVPAHLRDNRTFHIQLANAFAAYVEPGLEFWQDVILGSVRQLENGDLCVITRHRFHNPAGCSRYRWWMVFRENEWRFYECEEIDFGNRISPEFDVCINNVHPNLVNNLRTLREALDQMTRNNNHAEADRCLDRVNPEALPKSLQATYHLHRAVTLNRLGEHKAAADHADKALEKNPDFPGADYLKAVTCTWLHNYDVGLVHAKKFYAVLGDDAAASYFVGVCLHRLGRLKEATPYYRKSLDDDPTFIAPFVDLTKCITADDPGLDIGKRFLGLVKPSEKFTECAEALWKNRHGKALTGLAEAMRRREPLHVEAAFYLALAAMNQGNADTALQTFAHAWKGAAPKERRDYFAKEFSQSAARGDAAIRAYRELPAQTKPFRWLAHELWRDFRMDELHELVNEHAKQKTKDPYLDLYQAEVHLQAEDYAKAKQAYADAAANLKNVAELQDFRANRARTLYRLGEAMQAYAEIGPKDATFDELTQLCWQDKNFDLLAKLVAEHEKNDPGDPELPRWNWRIALERKQFDRIGPIVKQAYDANREPFVLRNFADDMVQAGQALEGYQRLPNPSVDVEHIASALVSHKKPKELRKLILLHRKQFPEDRTLGGLEGLAAYLEGDWKAAATSLAKAWPQLPDARIAEWRFHYLQSHHMIGQAVEAYRDLGMQQNDFRQLATMLLKAKNIDGFEKLLDAHRPQRAKDFEFNAYEARLKILRNKPDEATPLMAEMWNLLVAPVTHTILNSFVNDLLANGKAEDAYRCAPDRVQAFQQICPQLRQSKKIEEFEKIVKLHAVDHPKDIQLTIEQAELALLKNDPAKAETLFAALRAREDVANTYLANTGWQRARIATGKVEQTYRELGATHRIFLNLANECANSKNSEQLDRLLRVHRQAFPHATKYAAWEIEVLWLKQDYEGTIREIRARRETILKGQQRVKMESLLVRSCIRAKKFADAITEAEAITKGPTGWKNLMVLALASSADVKKTIAYVEKNAANPYFAENLYYDDDLGAILRSDAFRSFRDRYPDPRERH